MLGIMREKKITLGILNCFVETVSLRKKDDILKTQFERNFVKADADIVTEISLRFTGEIKHSNILNMAKKAIKGLLDNNSFGEKVDIDLIINNENVKVKQLKYDLKSYSENKFIGLTAENWVELNVDKIK